MVHGAKDYSNIIKSGLTYRVDDLGELAVRLKSPVIFDRRGDVIYMEDLTYGLDGLLIFAPGATASYALSTAFTYIPPFSIEMDVTNATSDYVTVEKTLPIPNESILGFSVSILMLYTNGRYSIRIDYNQGSKRYRGEVYIDNDNGTLILIDKLGIEHTLQSNLPRYRQTSGFISFKIKVDLINKTFYEIILNNVSYDVSEHNLKVTNLTFPNSVTCMVRTYGVTSAQATAYLDNFILTHNE